MLILTPTAFSLSPATPTSALDWVRSPDGRLAAEHGSGAPSLLPVDNDVVLMLPPRAVSWHRVALPKVAAGRLRAALDGMLEDLLLNDGCTGLAVLNPGIPQEVQFDEHKLLIVYGKDLRQYEQVLGDWNIPCRDDMRFITEAEHVHSTNDEYIQQFEQLKMRLGIESDY